MARHANRMAILRHLLDCPGDTRTRVATSLNLPLPTVAMLVRHLLHQGWLLEGQALPTGKRGKPALPLHVQRERLLSLRVEVDGSGVSTIATTRTGQALGAERVALPAGASIPELAGAAARALVKLQASLYSPDRRILDVDMGMTGLIGDSERQLQRLLAARLQGTPLRDAPVKLRREDGAVLDAAAGSMPAPGAGTPGACTRMV